MAGALAGRTCMVTGATSGVGWAAALELARQGAETFLIVRDRSRGEAAVERIMRATGNPEVEALYADLASLDEVREVARRFLELGRPLHVLLNNAGVVNVERRETVDGLEETFAVNHLSHFLLTHLLLERLRASAPARVVNVASDAHRFCSPLDFDDLQAQRRYRSMRVYGHSKLANLLFTHELARRLQGTGVTANAMHPGFVGSALGTNNGWLARLAMRAARPFVRTPEQGAETAVWLCTASELQDESGGYFRDRRPHAPRSHARDDAAAGRLWAMSERLTGLG